MLALIFANGHIDKGEMVKRAIAEDADPYVIAADGGARIALHFNLRIDLLVGDMDSISPQTLNDQKNLGVEIERHPPEKDFTDLELALLAAARRGMKRMRIIGGLGGRFDQTLANVYLLALPELEELDVSLVAGKQEIRLLRPGLHTLQGLKGDTLSLIPVGSAAQGIRTEGLYYPLHHETLEFGPARGVSNVMEQDQVIVELEQGALLAVHTLGKA